MISFKLYCEMYVDIFLIMVEGVLIMVIKWGIVSFCFMEIVLFKLFRGVSECLGGYEEWRCWIGYVGLL